MGECPPSPPPAPTHLSISVSRTQAAAGTAPRSCFCRFVLLFRLGSPAATAFSAWHCYVRFAVATRACCACRCVYHYAHDTSFADHLGRDATFSDVTLRFSVLRLLPTHTPACYAHSVTCTQLAACDCGSQRYLPPYFPTPTFRCDICDTPGWTVTATVRILNCRGTPLVGCRSLHAPRFAARHD